MIFIWEPLNRFAVTAQHEVFGHGYRIRSLRNTKLMGFHLDLPFPYGDSSGATYFSESQRVTVSDRLLVAIAGAESEYILATLQKNKWIAEGKIDPRTSNLYTESKLGTLLYALSTDSTQKDEKEINGNDLLGYLNLLKEAYPDHSLSFSKLKNSLYFNLLDLSIFKRCCFFLVLSSYWKVTQ